MLSTRFNNTTVPNISNLFDELFSRDIDANAPCSRNPSVNIIESENEYKIQMAAPGLEKSDFKVETEDRKLIISSDKDKVSLENGETYRKKEFSFGGFKRVFSIPNSLDNKNIVASYNSGILTVIVPKKDPVQAEVTKIEIS